MNPFYQLAEQQSSNPFYQLAAKENESKQRYVAQVGLGALETNPVSLGASLFKLATSGASQNILAELAENDPDLIKEVAEKARAESVEKIPTQETAERLIEEKTGLPLTPQTGGQHAVRFLSSVGRSGLPVKDLTKQAKRLVPGKKIEEKLASGLTKPKALEAKHAEKGIITSSRQEKSLNKLNEEAAKLTQQSIEKNVPHAKNVQQGFDFDFNNRFKNLESPMIHANPEINITPISEFLSDTAKKYRGLPKDLLADETKKVLKEVNVYRNNPQTGGANLYKLYRINNKKLNSIYEQRLLHGKQAEYADFLVDMNKSIAKSFEETLPKNGTWINEFKDLNKQFSDVAKANKTVGQLESVLNAEATPATIKKLASDPKIQKKLEISMGKSGADEVVQIAKDLKSAQDAIKRIPVKEYNKWDAILPFGLIIPGYNVPKGIAIIPKVIGHTRRAYGYLMTRPETRRAVKEAVEAISKNDIEAYKKAAAKITAANLSTPETK